MRHQQADKGYRTCHADAGTDQKQHQNIDDQTELRQIHPQRAGGAVTDVKQVQLISQQQYHRYSNHYHWEKLPELLPTCVGYASRKPVKNAVGVIFRQQQSDAGKGHAESRERDAREDQFVSVLGVAKSTTCGHHHQPAYATAAGGDKGDGVTRNGRRADSAGKRHRQRCATVNTE